MPNDALVLATLVTIDAVSGGALQRGSLKEWADQLIERGHLSPSICTLALDGSSGSESEVRHLAKLALGELDIQAERFADDRLLLSAYLETKNAMAEIESEFAFLATRGDNGRCFEDDRLWAFYILSCGIDDIRSGMGSSTHVWGMTDVNWKQIARRECENWLLEHAELAEKALTDLRRSLA